ncbi:MAG: hypothetical protein ACYC0C_11870 [Devosia sp.]
MAVFSLKSRMVSSDGRLLDRDGELPVVVVGVMLIHRSADIGGHRNRALTGRLRPTLNHNGQGPLRIEHRAGAIGPAVATGFVTSCLASETIAGADLAGLLQYTRKDEQEFDRDYGDSALNCLVTGIMVTVHSIALPLQLA